MTRGSFFASLVGGASASTMAANPVKTGAKQYKRIVLPLPEVGKASRLKLEGDYTLITRRLSSDQVVFEYYFMTTLRFKEKYLGDIADGGMVIATYVRADKELPGSYAVTGKFFAKPYVRELTQMYKGKILSTEHFVKNAA